ncbi:peptidogalycan biosysnthesis protein [Streptomyces sp. ISL-94]|uniref:peptidogalycan biosysnthesis protein n=1 Tax=Streptomyces sp. ISL-94 TaxID=2819190 RepID=UPI001BE84A37|nr:peptidogalycan biosysnthesis protein [Streptomyces sp. ISL-94]MBT2480760.1 GNAT family N-acetyltransferase [Streptomyces sp. ISL-94]
MSALAAFDGVSGGLPPEDWDALAGNRLYSSYDWLRFCATDIGGRTATGAVHAAGAAVSVTAVAEEPNPFYQWNTQLTARGLPAPDAAGLLVGQRRGYQTHLLTPGGATADRAAPALLDGVRSLAAELAGSELLDGAFGGPAGAKEPLPCVASFVGTPDVQALRAAGVRTAPVLLTTDAWVSIPEGGWPEWLRRLPSKGRRDSVKQEVKAFAAAGYEITREPLEDCYRQAADLLAGTQKRYGHSYDLHVLSESFRLQGAAMGAKAQVLFCARSGEPPVGFCLFYIHGDTLFVRAVGFDYERLIRGAAEYFNLVYYAAVRIAAENGLRWLAPGIESADAKALRGARLRPLWLLDLSERSVLLGRDDEVRAYNAAELSRLSAISPAVSKALEHDLYAPFC